MTDWRFTAAVGCAVMSAVVMLSATDAPRWAVVISGVLIMLAIFWAREDARLTERERSEQDAWVQKVKTANGFYLTTGPIVHIRPDTVGPPYPVTVHDGEGE